MVLSPSWPDGTDGARRGFRRFTAAASGSPGSPMLNLFGKSGGSTSQLAKAKAQTEAALGLLARLLEAEWDRQAAEGTGGTRAWELLCDVEALRRRLDSSWTELFASEHLREADES